MRQRQNAEKRAEKDQDKDSEMNVSDAEDPPSVPEDSDAKIGITAFITYISEVPCTPSKTGLPNILYLSQIRCYSKFN